MVKEILDFMSRPLDKGACIFSDWAWVKSMFEVRGQCFYRKVGGVVLKVVPSTLLSSVISWRKVKGGFAFLHYLLVAIGRVWVG